MTSIEIAATPQEVWDVVMDVERSHEWVTIHRRLGPHSDGDLRVGYEMEQTLCLRGVKFDVDWHLDELDEPHRAVWKGRGPARSRALIVNRMHPSFGEGLAEAAGERAATLAGTDLGGLYRNLADFQLVASREEHHLAGLASAVAPAPVVRVPFLSTDVHDVDGLIALGALML